MSRVGSTVSNNADGDSLNVVDSLAVVGGRHAVDKDMLSRICIDWLHECTKDVCDMLILSADDAGNVGVLGGSFIDSMDVVDSFLATVSRIGSN